jgi:hypothetical protein
VGEEYKAAAKACRRFFDIFEVVTERFFGGSFVRSTTTSEKPLIQLMEE